MAPISSRLVAGDRGCLERLVGRSFGPVDDRFGAGRTVGGRCWNGPMAAGTITSPEAREDTASGLLAAIAETNIGLLRGEVEKFRQAAVWADLHPVESICD